MGTTADRTATQKRMESAIDAVLGIAAIQFHDRPAIAARFAALVPGSAKKKAARPAPAPA